MPKIKLFLIISLFILLTGLAVFAIEQKMMSIQVKKGAVRSSPSFLGEIVVHLKYGDRVAVKDLKGSWYLIDRPKRSRASGQAWAVPDRLGDKTSD